MKIVSISTLAIGLLLSAFVFTGCKKPETGPQGSAGPQGPQGQGLSGVSSGFVTGTLTGTMRDGTPFTEPFSYNYYFGNESGTVDSLSFGSGYQFSFDRSINDIFSYNYASIDVTTTSKTATTGTMSLFFNFEKALGGNKLFRFNGSTPSSSVTSLTYNSSTGVFAGNFNINLPGSNNNTGNPATITGSFQATVMQEVYIKHQQPTKKVN